jgi:hypothetical protein
MKRIYHIIIYAKHANKFNKELEMEATNFINRAVLSGNYRAELIINKIEPVRKPNPEIAEINKNIKSLARRQTKLHKQLIEIIMKGSEKI